MMVKSISTKTMAFLIAASLPSSTHAFASTTMAAFSGVVAPQPSTSTTLLAHARRSHTVTRNTNKNDENTVQSVFAKIDKDGNGKIDRRELQEYLTSEGPYTKAVAQSIFDRLDENHDGHLVLSELATGMLEHSSSVPLLKRKKPSFKRILKRLLHSSSSSNNNATSRRNSNAEPKGPA